MSEKVIVVKGCNDCPFCYSEYDDYALNNDTLVYCILAIYNKSNKYFIDAYNDHGDDRENHPKETPDWCPLNNEELRIKRNNEEK